MSKDKNKKSRDGKTAPSMTPKEKKAAKQAKKNKKSQTGLDLDI